MPENARGRVLVVDDDPQVRSLFRAYLEDRYDVETATGGEDALATISDDVDVVLLDRIMPEQSGDEVLDQLRSRDVDCRVAMVTAVQPDLDIAELGFDDYVVKPVSKFELHNTVDSLLRWERYDTVVREYFGAARRVAVLEEQLEAEELDGSDEYQRLLDELDSLREEANATLDQLDAIDLEQVPTGFDADESHADPWSSLEP